MLNGMTDRCWRFFTRESEKDTFERRNEKLIEMAKNFQKHPKLKQLQEWEVTERFKKLLFESVDGELNMPEDGLPKMGTLYKLEGMIKKHLKVADKKPWFYEHWYAGRDRFRRIMELLKFHEGMKGHTNTHKTILNEWSVDVGKMYMLARASSEQLGALQSSGWIEKGYNWLAKEIPALEPQVIKDLNTMQIRYLKIMDPNYPKETYKGNKGLVAAEEFHQMGDTGRKQDSLEYFLKEGEGQIFGLVGDYLAMSKNQFKVLTNKNNQKNLSDIARKAVGIADIWRNESTGLGKKIQNSYIESIGNYIVALEKVKHYGENFQRYQEAISHAKNLLRFFEGDVERDGLLPILTFDVLPTLSEAMPNLLFPEATKTRTAEQKFEEGVDLLYTLNETLDTNLKLSKDYWTGRNPEVQARINYNLFPILDSYVKSAAEFQHLVGLTTEMIDAIGWSLNTVAKGGKDGKLNDAINWFMKDLQSEYFLESGVGVRKNPILEKFVALGTAYEYANKIGMSILSVLKQFNQGGVGMMYIGRKGLIQWADTKKNDKLLTDKVLNGAKKVGIAFMDVTEISSNVEYIKERDPITGMYRYKIGTDWGDKINKYLNVYARTGGKAFEWVENNFNRQYLFEMGYIQAWKADEINEHILRRNFDYMLGRKGKNIEEMKKNKNLRDPDKLEKKNFSEYELEFELFKRLRAENAGQEMVKFIHYDYHKIEKSPLFRGDHWFLGKAGSLMGQFTHYPQMHFTMMKRMLDSATGDIINGEIITPGTKTAARLSMYYILVNGFFQQFTNKDVSNIVENDSFERLRKWYKYLHSLYDPDNKPLQREIKRLWHGKGPIRAAGGAFFDSLFTYGMYTSVFDSVKKEPWFTTLFGDNFNEPYFKNKSTRERLMDVFNRPLSKYANKSLPRARNTQNPAANFFIDALNLYQNKEQRFKSKRFKAQVLGQPPVNEQKPIGENKNSVIKVLEKMAGRD